MEHLQRDMNTTLDFYDKNANDFAASTQSVDSKQTQERFINELMAGGKILDFSCDCGRDTKFVMEQGFFVDTVDGSENLCKIAREFTGITVRKMLFQDLDAIETYDEIWECSFILHLSRLELKGILWKMCNALTSDGIIYTSFKYGQFEGMRNGRNSGRTGYRDYGRRAY